MHAFCWFVRPENEFIDTFRSLDPFDDEQEGIAFCHMFSGGLDCGLANKPCSLGGNLFVAMDEKYPHPPIVPTGWCVNGQKFILNRSFKLVWGERSELVGWSTESKPGSTSFHDCCLRRTGTHQKLLHRKRKNAVARRAVLQASSPKHLEHLPVSQSADRSGCRLAIDAGPAGDVAKRGSGGPAW